MSGIEPKWNKTLLQKENSLIGLKRTAKLLPFTDGDSIAYGSLE